MYTTKLFEQFRPSYGMDKNELGKSLNLKTFDCAVPQPWADRHPNLMDYGIMVWLYDDESVFGRGVNIFPLLIAREREMLKALLGVYPPCNPRILNKWYNEAIFQVTRDYIYSWLNVAEGRQGLIDHEIFNEAHILYALIK